MKRFDQINMIPFIDVMLVLLAIVLTTASFVSQGLIEVNLPSAEHTTEPADDEDPVEIAINADNELFVKGDKLDFKELEKALADIPKEQLIVLRIDKAAIFEHFVKLIDQLKAQDFNNLSIQAQQEDGNASTTPDTESTKTDSKAEEGSSETSNETSSSTEQEE